MLAQFLDAPRHARVPRTLARFAGGIALTLVTSQAQASPILADGKLDSTYQLGFSVGFLDDQGHAIGDGRLYFGISSDDTQFLYFQLPPSYVDNTYGATAAVDWSHDHKFKDLLGSDRFGVTDKNQETGGFEWDGNSVTFDYIAAVCDQVDAHGKCQKGTTITDYRSGGVGSALNDGATSKNDGSINAGSAADIIEIATSLEYDFDQYGMTYLTDSPAMTSNTPGDISYVSALAPNWIYEVGYEIQFAPGTFNDSLWLDPDHAPGLITLGIVHASPNKKSYVEYGTPQCVLGCSPNSAPEPGSALLLGVGLGVLAWAKRRKSPGL
jgi:hypothetical protein